MRISAAPGAVRAREILKQVEDLTTELDDMKIALDYVDAYPDDTGWRLASRQGGAKFIPARVMSTLRPALHDAVQAKYDEIAALERKIIVDEPC